MILWVVVHGLFLALLGMWLGFPLSRAITAAADERTQLAWRASHTTLVTGGTFYIATAAVAHHLVLGTRAARLAATALVGASYLFAAVFIAGPLLGARGLQPVGPPAHVAVHVGFLGAIALLLIAVSVILWGGIAALVRGERT